MSRAAADASQRCSPPAQNVRRPYRRPSPGSFSAEDAGRGFSAIAGVAVRSFLNLRTVARAPWGERRVPLRTFCAGGGELPHGVSRILFFDELRVRRGTRPL